MFRCAGIRESLMLLSRTQIPLFGHLEALFQRGGMMDPGSSARPRPFSNRQKTQGGTDESRAMDKAVPGSLAHEAARRF